MKRISLNQNGFIPLIVSIAIIVAVMVFVVYTRVNHAHH
jgi:hypothetical protein